MCGSVVMLFFLVLVFSLALALVPCSCRVLVRVLASVLRHILICSFVAISLVVVPDG